MGRMIMIVTSVMLWVSAPLVAALPQSLLDPSFDKFFQDSGSFNQQFNQVQQQQLQRPQISQQPKPSQQITNRPIITLPPVVRQPSFPSPQSHTKLREDVTTPTLDHSEALERHALQKQQLAEVVQQHNEKVSANIRLSTPGNIAGLTTQQAPRFSPKTIRTTDFVKTTLSSDDTTHRLLKTFVADDDVDNDNVITTTSFADVTPEEEEQLSDLQRDAVVNLELISQLVQQVHQLGLRADRVLANKKLNNRVVKFADQRDNEIDDEEYYQYE